MILFDLLTVDVSYIKLRVYTSKDSICQFVSKILVVFCT